MRSDKYDPNNMATYVSESEPVVISISLLTGRLISLPKQWNRTGCYVTLTLYDVGEGQVIREKSSTDKSPGTILSISYVRVYCLLQFNAIFFGN